MNWLIRFVVELIPSWMYVNWQIISPVSVGSLLAQ